MATDKQIQTGALSKQHDTSLGGAHTQNDVQNLCLFVLTGWARYRPAVLPCRA